MSRSAQFHDIRNFHPFLSLLPKYRDIFSFQKISSTPIFSDTVLVKITLVETADVVQLLIKYTYAKMNSQRKTRN